MSLWDSLNEFKGQVVGKVSQTVTTIAQEIKDGADDLGYGQMLSTRKKHDNIPEESEYGNQDFSVLDLKERLAAEKSRSMQQYDQLHSSRHSDSGADANAQHSRLALSGDGFRKRGSTEEPMLTTRSQDSSPYVAQYPTSSRFRYDDVSALDDIHGGGGRKQPPLPENPAPQSQSVYTAASHHNNTDNGTHLQQQFQKAKSELIRLTQEHQEELQSIEQEHAETIHNLQVQSQAVRQENNKLKQDLRDLQRSKSAIESMAGELEQRLVQQNEQIENLETELEQEKGRRQDAAAHDQLEKVNHVESSTPSVSEEEYQRLLQQLSSLKSQLADYESRGIEAEERLRNEGVLYQKAVQDVESYRSTVTRLQNELDESQEALASRDQFWTSQLESSRTELDSANQQSQQLQQQLSRVEAECASYQQQLDALQIQRQSQDQEVFSLQNKIQEKETQLQEKMNEFSKTCQENDALRRELDQAKAGFGENQLQHHQQLQNLQDQLDDLREQYQQVVSDWQTVMDEKDSIERSAEKEISTKDQQLTKLTRNLEETDKELNSVMVENVQLQEKVSSLQQQLQQQNQSVSNEPLVDAELQSKLQEKVLQLEAEVVRLQAEIGEVNEDRDRVKLQLNKLKSQLIQRQEAEEEASTWRIEQEVNQAVNAVKQEYQSQINELERKLKDAESQLIQRSNSSLEVEEQLHSLKSTLAARNTELQNLQAALGELSYESEAATKLRHEVFTQQSRCRSLESQVDSLASQLRESEENLSQANQAAEQAIKTSQESQSQISQLSKECQNLRRALEESSKRMHALSSSQGSMVDRRIVAKLLTTFFERKQSKEVMELMAKMLDFDQEQRRRVGLDRGGGMLGSIFGRGEGGQQLQRTESDSFANQWADFLLQQATTDAADKQQQQNQQQSFDALSGIPLQPVIHTQERSYSQMVAAELQRSNQQISQPQSAHVEKDRSSANGPM
eukprot:TRINITY_DN10016_c0_g1_i1.p1 TRINITY_DN10016_c0_g1~~TRINITY_DN10016_c0_g1_i1.p1  ORF type:complete len:964 (-),score=162.60 TRINITY_DN10016_c0_g1_i1:635-3526(-)